MTWRHSLLLVLAITVARVTYLITLCPWDLVADEAHYWEWSRRLAGSYYTKGPGVAWAIAASTGLFGDHAWAIRLPAALAAGVTALALGRLAMEITRDPRPGFLTAAACLLMPGYIGIAQLMTIDGPYVACWAVALWLAWRALNLRPTEPGPARPWVWAGLGLALGVGFLFKYTILLLIPGLVLFAVIDRRRQKQTHPATQSTGALRGLLLGGAVFLITISPVLIWNQRHGWPTVAHLLGALHLPGGDLKVGNPWSPMYFLEFVGAQIGLVGPFGLVLMILGQRAMRRAATVGDRLWRGWLLVICSAAPLLGFYVLIAVFKKAQANWAIAAYGPLLIPAAWWVARELPRHAQKVRQWQALPKPRPKQGWLRKKPEAPAQVAWHWYIGCGVVAIVLVGLGPALVQLPGLRDIHGLKRAAIRVSGHAQWARQVAAAIQQAQSDDNDTPPLVITDLYWKASLTAFYVPDHPTVFCAHPDAGGRRSAYDFFPDTDLTDPALAGRTAVLIGGNRAQWETTFGFAHIETTDKTGPDRSKIFIAHPYPRKFPPAHTDAASASPAKTRAALDTASHPSAATRGAAS